MVSAIVVADTSVLINFLRIDRMDLIAAHPASFIATDHVAAEITDTYPEQQARYAAALNAAQIIEQRIDDPAELEIFLRLAAKGRLGAGERVCHRGRSQPALRVWPSTTRGQFNRPSRKQGLLDTPLMILRTQDIVVELIRNDVMSVEAADAIRVDWATNHRFKLKIASFRELL